MKHFWTHDCPVDGLLSIARGECCPWCGAAEPRRHLRLLPEPARPSAPPEAPD